MGSANLLPDLKNIKQLITHKGFKGSPDEDWQHDATLIQINNLCFVSLIFTPTPKEFVMCSPRETKLFECFWL